MAVGVAGTTGAVIGAVADDIFILDETWFLGVVVVCVVNVGGRAPGIVVLIAAVVR